MPISQVTALFRGVNMFALFSLFAWIFTESQMTISLIITFRFNATIYEVSLAPQNNEILKILYQWGLLIICD